MIRRGERQRKIASAKSNQFIPSWGKHAKIIIPLKISPSTSEWFHQKPATAWPSHRMRKKPERCGSKVFLLTDSSNGYTWDFCCLWRTIKRTEQETDELWQCNADSQNRLLGTGYKLFVDHFYTSPVLFRDLLQQKIWVCGSIRTKHAGFPKPQTNSLDPKSAQGSIRWLRDNSVLFVQWRDTRDVLMCSTLHTAHGEETVLWSVTGADGKCTLKHLPVPPAVKEYNRCVLYIQVFYAFGNVMICVLDICWYLFFPPLSSQVRGGNRPVRCPDRIL